MIKFLEQKPCIKDKFSLKVFIIIFEIIILEILVIVNGVILSSCSNRGFSGIDRRRDFVLLHHISEIVGPRLICLLAYFLRCQ